MPTFRTVQEFKAFGATNREVEYFRGMHAMCVEDRMARGIPEPRTVCVNWQRSKREPGQLVRLKFLEPQSDDEKADELASMVAGKTLEDACELMTRYDADQAAAAKDTAEIASEDDSVCSTMGMYKSELYTQPYPGSYEVDKTIMKAITAATLKHTEKAEDGDDEAAVTATSAKKAHAKKVPAQSSGAASSSAAPAEGYEIFTDSSVADETWFPELVEAMPVASKFVLGFLFFVFVFV